MTKQWKQRKQIQKYAYLGIAVSLVILVAISSISYQSLVKIKNDFNLSNRTSKVLLNLSYFLSNLKDAEMAQRNYLLTGKKRSLEPLRYLEKGLEQYFKDLRKIAAENTPQKKKIEIFEELVEKKLFELRQLIELQNIKGEKAAQNAMLASPGKKIMDEMRILALKIDNDERLLIEHRAKRIERNVKLDTVVKAVGIIIILLMTIFVISGLNYWFAEYTKLEKKQTHMANTDELTDLVNRRHFFEILEREVLQAKIRRTSLALMMLDIDNFKNINDTYGHLGGDEILKLIGQILQTNVYSLDVVARYGGEEFVVLLPSTSSTKAYHAAEKLRKIVEQFQWKISDKQISVTISIGLVNIDSNNLQDTYELIEKADEALYIAKRSGRNCVIRWDKAAPLLAKG